MNKKIFMTAVTVTTIFEILFSILTRFILITFPLIIKEHFVLEISIFHIFDIIIITITITTGIAVSCLIPECGQKHQNQVMVLSNNKISLQPRINFDEFNNEKNKKQVKKSKF